MRDKFELRIVSSDILELLAFNEQKFTESGDFDDPFRKNFQGHDGTFHGSMLAKFEVRIFSHFGAIRI